MSWMNWFSRESDRARRAGANGTSLKMPATTDAWWAYQDACWASYYAEPYTDGQIKDLGLFQARDEDTLTPNLIANTAKVVSDLAFVVDVAAAHTLGGALGLNDLEASNNNTTDSPSLQIAKAVWRRSEWQENVVEAVLSTMMMGEGFVEAFRSSSTQPYRTRLVHHDARCVEVFYDGLLHEIVEARIRTMQEEKDGVTNTTVRILTRDRVRVEYNGKTQSDLPHALGAVPLVHLRAIPVMGDGQRHAVSVAHNIRAAIAQVDSAFSQSRSILTRNGNPIFVITGARLADGAPNPFQLGRVLNLPLGAAASYEVVDVDSVRAALESAEKQRAAYVSTLPEFLFSQLTAGESGEARQYRTDLFVQKYTQMRQRVILPLARVTQMAVEMEEGRRHEPDRERFAINQPPVLALDRAKEVETICELRAKNLIRPADAVRRLQGLGYVPADRDPEEYAALLADDDAAQARVFFAGQGKPATGQQPDETGDDGAADYP